MTVSKLFTENGLQIQPIPTPTDSILMVIKSERENKGWFFKEITPVLLSY